MRSRSKLASAPKMLKMSLPPAVVVSIDSVSDRNPTPLSSKSVIVYSRCGRFRPSRSSRQTQTVSPARRCENRLSSSGRLVVAPLATSVQIREQPAALSASLCRSRVCSAVETLA